ncbi:hypothetical protein D3C86_1868880 [compost metagenome]
MALSFSPLLDDVLIHDEAEGGSLIAEPGGFIRTLTKCGCEWPETQLLGNCRAV